MVKEIRQAKGYSSNSEVFRQGVIDLYSRTFPKYILRKGTNTAKKTLTPAEVVEFRENEKIEKLKLVRIKQVKICERLGGTVVNKNDGGEYCEYYNYSGKTRFIQNIPLSMITDDLPKIQYQPSKDQVLDLQRKGRVDYEVRY